MATLFLNLIRLLLLSVMLFSTTAFALKVPSKSPLDGRIQFVNYSSKDVVNIAAHEAIVTQIVFNADERILDIATGFSTGWQIIDKQNIVFIKPMAVKSGKALQSPKPGTWDTNLLITTNKHLYAFDLKLHFESSNAIPKNVAYRVSFGYPEDELEAKKAAQEKITIEKKLNDTKTPRNWDYTMRVADNSNEIAPIMAYDDGIFTYLKFNKLQAFPAVFYLNSNGESMVNSFVKNTKEGNILIIQQIGKRFVLRLGDKVVGIENHALGQNPGLFNNTANDDVKRVIK